MDLALYYVCDNGPHSLTPTLTRTHIQAYVQMDSGPVTLCCFIESHGELILCHCLVITQHPHSVHCLCFISGCLCTQTFCVCVCVFNQWMQLFVSSSDGFYIKRTAIMQGCQCLLFTTSSAWMYVLFWYQWISLLIVKVTQYLWQYVMTKDNFRTLRFSEICVSYQDSIWVYGYADLANLYLVSIVPV